MNIQRRLRYLFLPVAGFAIVMTLLAIRSVTSDIVRDLTEDMISHESRYMFDRTIPPIKAEIDLVKQIAKHELIISWARNPGDEDLTKQAMAFLNTEKRLFQSNSFFAALKKNLHYYHNNDANEFYNDERRYTLSPDINKDQWFFSLITNIDDHNLNVDRDRELNIVQLWLNIPIRDNGEILGIIGTGFELSNFIAERISSFDESHSVIMIDNLGAIHLDNNIERIVYGSAGLDDTSKRTIFDSLSSRDAVLLREAMASTRINAEKLPIVEIDWNGSRQYVGVIYIPLFDWYQLTLVDIEKALPSSDFANIYVIIIATIILTLLMISFGVNRYVVTPLKALRRSTIDFTKNRNFQLSNNVRTKEFQDLNHAFNAMSQQILNHEKTLNQKISQRTQELIQAEKLSSLGSIAAGLAHEINNPLGFMRSNLDMISDYLSTLEPHLRALKNSNLHAAADEELDFIIDDMGDALSDSINGCARISHIVQGLKLYAQQEKGIIEPFLLNDIAFMAIEVSNIQSQTKAKFSFGLCRTMPLMDIDPKAMTSIIASMLTNAVEAVQHTEKQEVVLTTFANNKHIGVIIADTGHGINPDDMSLLFTPFHTTKPIGSGLGLNLAVAMATVKSFEGNIEVSSELNKGTTFKIVFPRPIG